MLCQLSIKINIVVRSEIMINLTGLNNKEFVLNHIHIEKIEQVPETVITLTNGKKYLVLEDVDEIIEKCIAYTKKTNEVAHLK